MVAAIIARTAPWYRITWRRRCFGGDRDPFRWIRRAGDRRRRLARGEQLRAQRLADQAGQIGKVPVGRGLRDRPDLRHHPNAFVDTETGELVSDVEVAQALRRGTARA